MERATASCRGAGKGAGGLAASDTSPFGESDRARLLALGADLKRTWDLPGTTAETRKKIIRMLINEIFADVVDDNLELVIHWQGGDHTRLSVGV